VTNFTVVVVVIIIIVVVVVVKLHTISKLIINYFI